VHRIMKERNEEANSFDSYTEEGRKGLPTYRKTNSAVKSKIQKPVRDRKKEHTRTNTISTEQRRAVHLDVHRGESRESRRWTHAGSNEKKKKSIGAASIPSFTSISAPFVKNHFLSFTCRLCCLTSRTTSFLPQFHPPPKKREGKKERKRGRRDQQRRRKN